MMFLITLLFANFSILTLFKVNEMKKERDWFFMIITFFLMNLITFVIEVCIWDQTTRTFYLTTFIADSIKIFTALNAVILFGVRNDVFEVFLRKNKFDSDANSKLVENEDA